LRRAFVPGKARRASSLGVASRAALGREHVLALRCTATALSEASSAGSLSRICPAWPHIAAATSFNGSTSCAAVLD
jgi:hypothetical protein